MQREVWTFFPSALKHFLWPDYITMGGSVTTARGVGTCFAMFAQCLFIMIGWVLHSKNVSNKRCAHRALGNVGSFFFEEKNQESLDLVNTQCERDQWSFFGASKTWKVKLTQEKSSGSTRWKRLHEWHADVFKFRSSLSLPKLGSSKISWHFADDVSYIKDENETVCHYISSQNPELTDVK